MFGRILMAALLGGLIGGLVLTAIQSVKVVPLILEAETYEGAAHEQGAEGDGHAHDHGSSAPLGGMERFSFTLATNILSGVGFALLLTAAFALRGRVDWRQGILWGLAGYAIFSLAPALGLPPELPGMASAELVAKQIWWIVAVAGTAAGLALAIFIAHPVMRIAGAVLIAAPHIIGAPRHEAAAHGAVPAELAAAFVSATLVANLLFWLVMGGASAYAFDRLSNSTR